MTDHEAHDLLNCYTLERPDPAFHHQHVVDAFAAQNADARTPPITLAFALIGLHLHVDRQLSGRQVQRVHQSLATGTRRWPIFALPSQRGTLTALDALMSPPGGERDRAISRWCASVWSAFHGSHAAVVEFLRSHRTG